MKAKTASKKTAAKKAPSKKSAPKKAPAKSEAELAAQLPTEHLTLAQTFLLADDIPYRKVNKGFVTELAESIKENGLDMPVVLWNYGDPEATAKVGTKTLPVRGVLAGRHRWQALKLFRKTDKEAFLKMFPRGRVPFRVFGGNKEEAIALFCRENLQRFPLTVRELIGPIIQLKESGLSDAAIGSRVGKSKAFVNHLLTVKDQLGDEVLAQVADGTLTFRDARDLAMAKRKGKNIDEDLEKAKQEGLKKKAAGKQRILRQSLKASWEAYTSMPSKKSSVRIELLEAMIQYQLKLTEELPEVLVVE